jgi:hypothetical protein
VKFHQSLADVLHGLPFDEVDVVGFGDAGPMFDSGFSQGFPLAWSSPLDADERARLRYLVAALPEGESARCHLPPFGLRIRSGAREIRISICFACSNAYVVGQLTVFEARSEEGGALLEFLRAHAPASWQSSE